MKRGDTIEAVVRSLSAKGDGVAQVGEREITLRGTVPGDRVNARLLRKRKGRFDAEVLDVLEPGVERCAPVCPHFGTCGGCRWQDIPYADQVELKVSMTSSALAGAGVDTPTLEPALGAVSPLYYRNKMEFSFGAGREGELQLGLHVRGRYNHVFNVSHCHLQSEVSNRIVISVRSQAAALGLSPYDLRQHTGLLRFLVIRQSGQTGQVLVNLVVSKYPDDGTDALVRAVLADVPEISTWVVSLHQGRAQVAVGEAEYVVHGAGTISDGCNGVDYEISPRSFYQTNSAQAARLYAAVVDLAGDLPEVDVLDLYSGAGGISLQLAAHSRSVYGIESVGEAVEDARRNAAANGVGNCVFAVGEAEKLVPELVQRRFGLVVVDPPRAGLHKKVLRSLLELDPERIVYVSCNPWTLADDLAVLAHSRYRVDCVRPVDMFPQTPHCEVIVRLLRLDGARSGSPEGRCRAAES
jgi:23S rRNA (uracil1939-C5)-methyltransferase